MFAISICRGCGRTMDNAYFYCPWCGQSRSLGMKDKDSVEKNFEMIEDQKKTAQQKKIQQMKNRLDELESELSVLVLSTEMHK